MDIIRKKTCAIIITFNPDKLFPHRLNLIKKQFKHIIIVDNGSTNNIKLLIHSDKNTYLIENNENLGIANAINIGIESAIKLNLKWIVTFDQDSIIENNLLCSLIKIKTQVDSENSIIGSNYWNSNKNNLYINCNNRYKERKTVITSGMFFSTSLIKDIGGFQEKYFIDSVDHEFCLRARKNNYKIYISCKSLMKHSIGEERKTKSITFDHPPQRVYYMTRNTLLTIKTYLFREPIWCICQLLRLNIEFLMIIVKNKQRGRKAHFYLKGVKDAIIGRVGKINIS